MCFVAEDGLRSDLRGQRADTQFLPAGRADRPHSRLLPHSPHTTHVAMYHGLPADPLPDGPGVPLQSREGTREDGEGHCRDLLQDELHQSLQSYQDNKARSVDIFISPTITGFYYKFHEINSRCHNRLAFLKPLLSIVK